MDNKIEARSVDFPFDPAIDKHWFGGSAFRTHWLNSYTLIIPDGEKYVLRSTKRYLGRVEGELKNRVLGLLAQEALHSREHEKFYHNLRIQGYKVDGFLRLYRTVCYDMLERFGRMVFSPNLMLSTAAGLEHINVVIADIGLTRDFLAGSDPQVRPLFEWHYAEEIEHKAVCHDVLQVVAPSYPLRLAGLLFASMTFVNFLALGTAVLLWQDGEIATRKTLREAGRFFFSEPGFFFRYWSAVRAYFRRRFHPDQQDDYYLAQQVFAGYGPTGPPRATRKV
jgi:predicted metal-dependent hydrolase